MTKTWDRRLVANCPRCNHTVEDNSHILRCQVDGALEVWKLSVDKVQAWMDSNHTCPDLAKLVINILTNFKSGYAIILHDEIFFDGVGKSLMLIVE